MITLTHTCNVEKWNTCIIIIIIYLVKLAVSFLYLYFYLYSIPFIMTLCTGKTVVYNNEGKASCDVLINRLVDCTSHHLHPSSSDCIWDDQRFVLRRSASRRPHYQPDCSAWSPSGVTQCLYQPRSSVIIRRAFCHAGYHVPGLRASVWSHISSLRGQQLDSVQRLQLQNCVGSEHDLSQRSVAYSLLL